MWGGEVKFFRHLTLQFILIRVVRYSHVSSICALYFTALYCTVLYCTVLYYVGPYCAVLY